MVDRVAHTVVCLVTFKIFILVEFTIRYSICSSRFVGLQTFVAALMCVYLSMM